MTDDKVVVLKRREPEEKRLIWVCQCGCSTFELSNDGSAQCAFCRETREEGGGWFRKDHEPEWMGDEPISDVQGNGSVEFAQRVVAKRALSDDAVALIVIRENGTIHVWSDLETDEQVDWTKRRIDDAKDLLDLNTKRDV